MDVQLIIKNIKQKQQNGDTLLIAIDGRSGSGKSYLAEQIKNQLPNVKIIPLDVFGMYDGKVSSERVIDEVITPLKITKLQIIEAMKKDTKANTIPLSLVALLSWMEFLP